MDNTRSAGLFLLIGAVSAAAALPFPGLASGPWSGGPAPAPAATTAPEAKPAAAPEEKTAVTAPAPKKKTRIVWVGGGADWSSSNGAGGGKPAVVPRLQTNTGGSQVKIQPVGGYIATTATPRRG
jgi:hypothetical protein